MLDLTKFRLIPLSGIGRSGIQGRVFTLGSDDDLGTVLQPGYIDHLVKTSRSKVNRDVIENDLIILNYDVLTTDQNWVITTVTYDESADSYTLVSLLPSSTFSFNEQGTGGSTTETFTGLTGVRVGAKVVAGFSEAPANTSSIITASSNAAGSVTVTYSADPGAHRITFLAN